VGSAAPWTAPQQSQESRRGSRSSRQRVPVIKINCNTTPRAEELACGVGNAARQAMQRCQCLPSAARDCDRQPQIDGAPMTLNRMEQHQVAGGGWAFVVVRKHGTPSFLRCFLAAFWQTPGSC